MTEELFREDAYAPSCEAVIAATAEDGICLDRTVFYPMGGGQPGDRGRLILSDGGLLEVVDTLKGPAGILHRIADGGVMPEVGAELIAEVDWSRRHRLMRMHSAMHLLCAAVGHAVTGGQVGEQKSRLDFDVAGDQLDKEAIGRQLQLWIAEDHPIRHFWIDAEELQARPELVRTMSVRPPTTAGKVRLVEIDGVNLQACGGTHVHSTGEIGEVQIGKIENKGRQNRRVNLLLAT